MIRKNLQIGVVANSLDEFEKFVNQRCFPNNDSYNYIFISDISSTNSLNVDLLLLANESMADTFDSCRFIVR